MEEAPLRAGWGRTLGEILEAFIAHTDGDDVDAPAAPWGEKVGFSVYDEEEVLGALDASKRSNVDALLHDQWQPWGIYGDDEAYGDLDWREQEGEDDDADDDDDYYGESEEGAESEDDDGLQWIDHYEAAQAALWVDSCDAEGSDELPRAVRCIRPLCWIGPLEQDLAEECPICLEDLERGQLCWRLPCLHVFHETCTMHCFRRRRSRLECPLCRTDIKRVAGASLEESAVATAALAALTL